MKKVFIFLSIALFSALFALSCQSLSVSIEDVTQPEGRTFTCVFAQPDPDTKINVDLSNGKTTWKAGDKILINAGSSGTSRRTVTLTAGDIFDEGKKAIITIPGDLNPYDRKEDRGIVSTYYAMYPADNVASGSLYYNQAFSNQNDFLMAACNVGDTFVFYNLCGVIAYTVDDGEEYDFDQVVFSGKDGETVAYDTYQARVRDDGEGAYVEYTKNADSYNPLVPRTSCTNSVVSDGSTVNYIFLPGGTDFSTGFTFSFLSGGVIKKTASANAAKNVAPGYILKLGDISSHLKAYVPPTKHDNTIEVDVATAIDLSSSATANCYIVEKSLYDIGTVAGASFKFRAAMGKGGDVLTTIGGDEDKDVVVLWETQNNNTAPSKGDIIAAVDYDLQTGEDAYIVFKMPTSFKAGNALIAAKNAGGDILWSWHIWVPETAIGSRTYGFSGSKQMQDRNLGALVVADKNVANPQASGFFYQWGRKDPMKALASLTSESLAATYPANVWTNQSGQATFEAARQNPTVFYKGSYLWSAEDFTGRWGTSKTVNDPCPVGYKVPAYGDTSLFDYVTPANYDAWAVGTYGFDAGTEADGSTAFLFSGYPYYSSGNFDLFGTAVRLWTTTTYNLDPSKGTARALQVTNENAASCSGQRIASAHAIRCIVE